MSASPPARPHRRARVQLLAGYLALLVVGGALLVVLLVRLASARAELDRASAVGSATVVASGQAPGGRGVRVTIDTDGTERSGVLVLPRAARVAAGTRLDVNYDPRSPVGSTLVHAGGDATDSSARNLLFGVVAVAVVLLGASVLTGLRLLTAARLRRAPATDVVATRFVVRQGLLVRDWLELVTGRGVRWLPVYWSAGLARLAPGSTIAVRGRPDGGRPVLPVVDGGEVWPSGRVRARPPRGDRRPVDPDPEADGRWGRQLRGDAVGLVVAPVLGLLWAYVDGSGTGGFAVVTLLSAGTLFWLTEYLGSDPAPPPRG